VNVRQKRPFGPISARVLDVTRGYIPKSGVRGDDGESTDREGGRTGVDGH